MMHSGLRRIEATLDRLDLGEAPAPQSADMAHLGVPCQGWSSSLSESLQESLRQSAQKSSVRSRLESRTIQPFPLSVEPLSVEAESWTIKRLANALFHRDLSEQAETAVVLPAKSVLTPRELHQAESTPSPPSLQQVELKKGMVSVMACRGDLMEHRSEATELSGIVQLGEIAVEGRGEMVKPFVVDEHCSKPALPKVKGVADTEIGDAHLGAQGLLGNSQAIAKLLKGISTTIAAWQSDLSQIIQQIQTLYDEGPILEGWLESRSHQAWQTAPSQSQVQSPSPMPGLSHGYDAAKLRHGEVEDLMSYVEAICRHQPMPLIQEPRPDYRLCGLNEEGHIWSRPCPAEQVPYVSLAIARYQKLRSLLADKQELEHRLNHLIQSLTILYREAKKS